MSAHAALSLPAADVNPWLLRIGAVAGVVGIPLQVVVSSFHPARIAPNDSAAVFLEYAASSSWTLVHIGQFFATLVITLGFIVLARSLVGARGLGGAFAVVGATALGVVIAVFAVQMALDGVALIRAIEAWLAAPPADKAATFAVAESVRWLEKGLSGFFHLANGTAILALGASILASGVYHRAIGLVGIAAGFGFLGGGVSTTHTGFSAEASQTLSISLLLVVVFIASASISMWLRSSRVGATVPGGAAAHAASAA